MHSLRTKLAFSHVLPTILLLPILSLYFLFRIEDLYIHDLLRQLVYQAELIREDIEQETQPVTDITAAQHFLSTLVPPTGSHAVLIDLNGAMLASTRPEDSSRVGKRHDHPSVDQALAGQTVSGVGPGLAAEVAYVAIPWRRSNQVDGVLRLSFEVNDVRAQFDQLQWLIISGSIFAAVVALGTAFGLATTITRPLIRLTDRAREIAAGNYSSRVDTRGRDEVGLLGQSFNRMAERLEEAQQTRERQFAAIAHELARPLSGVRAGVETLREEEELDPAFRHSLLTGMEEELARLERLIITLQGLHRRALQPMQLNCTRVDLGRLVRATVENMQTVATRNGIHLSVEVPGDLLHIQADEDRLIQVMTNLIDNALKFTPRSGRVQVQVSEEARGLRVSVSDTGVGVAADELNNLFQQFYRGNESRPVEKRGMGLGLAICREIINAHGGKIWVESAWGQGARFAFLLPKQ